ncbi:hypothetical protein PG996_009481 [Apiospora saccharicola]|uniref:Uncharacterized protein n=1 Tax=Apiospora saccharicola TaxID=335842 RepID=A0ABR1UKV3_9PEZI
MSTCPGQWDQFRTTYERSTFRSQLPTRPRVSNAAAAAAASMFSRYGGRWCGCQSLIAAAEDVHADMCTYVDHEWSPKPGQANPSQANQPIYNPRSARVLLSFVHSDQQQLAWVRLHLSNSSLLVTRPQSQSQSATILFFETLSVLIGPEGGRESGTGESPPSSAGWWEKKPWPGRQEEYKEIQRKVLPHTPCLRRFEEDMRGRRSP